MMITVITLIMKTIKVTCCRKANGEDLEECEKEKLEVFGETK